MKGLRAEKLYPLPELPMLGWSFVGMMTAVGKAISKVYQVRSLDYSRNQWSQPCGCKLHRDIGPVLSSLEIAMRGLQLEDIDG